MWSIEDTSLYLTTETLMLIQKQTKKKNHLFLNTKYSPRGGTVESNSELKGQKTHENTPNQSVESVVF